ncbi:MAG: hypothetical protein M1834_009716 [Cirrosporium novae-zelandiae]|nr:MAG: hypothetical protein M1834_009716 [Cirrosporium novae-zelandiae]
MAAKNVFTNIKYEQDPRWVAVDDYTFSNLHPSTRPNTEALRHALVNARDQGLPDIATNPMQGKFISLQCRLVGAKHALEVGTLGGYGSIWLATENPGLHITTIEMDPKRAEVARKNIAFAGVGDRVEVIVGVALEVLLKLEAEIQEGTREPFGFTYIDADASNNWAYFDLAAKMSNVGACICVDNVVCQGKLVAEEFRNNPRVQGIRKVVEEVGKDTRVDAVVIQTVGEKDYDGFLMAMVVSK